MKSISLGVRDFALPVPRIGSIEAHSGYGPMPKSGQSVHDEFLRKRRAAIAGYDLEVKVKYGFASEKCIISVTGRIDGVYQKAVGTETIPVFEEIKTDFNIALLKSVLKSTPEHPYWLQLKTYGYIYFKEAGVMPELALVLVSMRDGSHELLETQLDVKAYEQWLGKRIPEVLEEYENIETHRGRRQLVSKALKFPFDAVREGQQQLIDDVSASVRSGRSMLVQAPTGIGKTIGVMFPTLKSSMERGAQLIYVTPKNSQHAVARGAVEKFQADGHDVRAMILTAKAKVCLKEQVMCNPDYCEYAKDYYEKLYQNDVVEKASQQDFLDKDHFVRYGKKYKVCPFELSLDCVKNVDIVIGDYNYVFSPRNIMGRFTSPYAKKKEKPDLVVDEAHNLPDRAASYYSASISLNELKAYKSKLAQLSPHVALRSQALLEQCILLVGETAKSRVTDDTTGIIRGGSGEHPVKIDKDKFVEQLAKLGELASEYLGGVAITQSDDPILNLHRAWDSFVNALHYSGDEFVTLYKNSGGGTLKHLCMDASKMLIDSYRSINTTVAFSATLKPFQYYADLGGLNIDDIVTREMTSPFPPSNRKLLVIPQVSTKYADRPRNYPKVAQAIEKITAQKSGNYVVFFPSFEFLQKVEELVKIEHADVLIQRRDMPAHIVEEFLTKMKENGAGADTKKSKSSSASKVKRPIILFAVQGGTFSEGVDYPGDMLIGSIIVGPGLPVYDLERETLKDYFENKYGSGTSYAFTYPAMTRVVQSAGRVIRSENDRGIIVLLDRRFLTDDYCSVMPGDWYNESVNELVSNEILKDIREFWDSTVPEKIELNG